MEFIKIIDRAEFAAQDIIGYECNNNVVVYQAYCPEIADHALAHQTLGGPNYSFQRMSWIKTSFLWMMYRSGWGEKVGQERVLAIEIPCELLAQLISEGRSTRPNLKNELTKKCKPEILVQLDPDRDIAFNPLQRRAIQIGLRDQALRQYVASIIKIVDLTLIIEENRAILARSAPDQVFVPREGRLEQVSQIAAKFLEK